MLIWGLVYIADVFTVDLDLVGDSQLSVRAVLVYRHNLLPLILPYLNLLLKGWRSDLILRLDNGVDDHGILFKFE